MRQVIQDIIDALKALNGIAPLHEIYNRCPQYSDSYIRNQIQSHSSDSKTYPKFEDLFFSVDGIGNGIWGLRNFILDDKGNSVNDFQERQSAEPVERKLTTYNRILRNTVLANEIKKLIDYRCQLCDIKINLPDNQFYIEAHHIKPLGYPFNGPDVQENILIVCPNCHIKCDYKLIELSLDQIKNNLQKISIKYIDFHNTEYKIKIQS
ncbi:MAG: HNH endonuclease [Bacteroidetes bacterium]|nr:HNH endonuclease [Bacteroidota bacterium]